MQHLSRKRLDQIATMDQPLVTMTEVRRMAREVKHLREQVVQDRVDRYREGVQDAVTLIPDIRVSKHITEELIGEREPE